jgi:hypothetical protein
MTKHLEHEGHVYPYLCPFGDGECYGNEQATVFTDRSGKVDLFIPKSTFKKAEEANEPDRR